MARHISFSLPLLLLCVCVLHAQQSDEAPFASLERAVQAERGGWAGDKSRLSKVFDDERKRLGSRFEIQLLKWLGTDPEKHYWISSFLEAESYLHGSKSLPHFSLLVKEQGLALVHDSFRTSCQNSRHSALPVCAVTEELYPKPT